MDRDQQASDALSDPESDAVFDPGPNDQQTGETTLVSVDSQGGQGFGFSMHPAISGDGRFVAFLSSAINLVPDDTNGVVDLFVHDRQTGETTRANVSSQGGQANDRSQRPAAISRDGRFVTFESSASNLVLGDTNKTTDAFVRDRTGPCGTPASWANYGSGWAGTNGIPGLVAKSNPTLCGTLDMFADNSSGADTTGVLIGGFTNASLATAWSGTVLLLPALLIPVPVPFSGLPITTGIPCDDSLCGLIMFVQVVEMDPGASRGVSFTPGLELRLGVQ